jgi:hypothetical protein
MKDKSSSFRLPKSMGRTSGTVTVMGLISNEKWKNKDYK